MEGYLKNYFDILINTTDIETIKMMLPSLSLDKTNDFIDCLVDMLYSESDLAVEIGDTQYIKHLEAVSNLLLSKKTKIPTEDIPLQRKNTIVFSQGFLKSLKPLEDSALYREILFALSSLESKEWMENNAFNPTKYKRLHGGASGLSEIKGQKIRLLHVPINSDFWYVAAAVIKEGDGRKKFNEDLIRIREDSQSAVAGIISEYSIDGEIDYKRLNSHAESMALPVMQELRKWEDKKNEK